MKILLLGHGIANDGCKSLLEKNEIKFDYLNLDELNDLKYDYVIKSPGICLDEIKDKNIEGKIISDLELFNMFCRGFVIVVTGSNGKTSVVTMLGKILETKYKVCVCGNIGYSCCQALVDNPLSDIYIIEASSFMLETSGALDVNIGVILNISSCHLDHHKNINNYVTSKLNLGVKQSPSHYLVYNIDNSYLKNIERYVCSILVPFGISSTINRVYLLGNNIYFKTKKIYHLSKDEINYKHIIENKIAVLSVISLMNFNLKKAAKILKRFEPVKFRLNKIDNQIYNDAKSTNCASTDCAIKSIGKCILICGGYERNISINLSDEALNNIVMVMAYGESKYNLEKYFSSKKINIFVFNSLKEALENAYKAKNKNVSILYSPMYASFDQYNSYNERGEEFNRLYKIIKNGSYEI